MRRREVMMAVALAATIGLLIGRWTSGPGVGAAPLRGGIPDQKGLIHACYGSSNGALRVIDPSSTKCHIDEAKITWRVKPAAAKMPTPDLPIHPCPQ